jgi:hypothetical protein
VSADCLPPSAFVNCAFGEARREIFDALVFSLRYCQIAPVIAPSRPGHGILRLEYIRAQIAECSLSIHDITPAQGGEGRDRLNTILELGIALGDKSKRPILILAASESELHNSCSDLRGLDIAEHGGEGAEAARVLALSLADHPPPGIVELPDAEDVKKSFINFRAPFAKWSFKKGLKSDDNLSHRARLIGRWMYKLEKRG